MIKKALAALFVLGAVFAISWHVGVRQRLANEAKLARAPSVATASPTPTPIVVPLVTEAAEPTPEASATPEAAPDVLKKAVKLRKSGQKRICKSVFGLETCVDTDWNVDVTTEGEPNISRNGDLFRVSIPVRVSGEASASSEDFKNLKVDNRKFSGLVDAWADVGINPEDGCTITAVTTGLEWREEPEIELVGGLQVKVGELVKSHFEKALQEAVESMKLKASCEMVRQQIERLRGNGDN